MDKTPDKITELEIFYAGVDNDINNYIIQATFESGIRKAIKKTQDIEDIKATINILRAATPDLPVCSWLPIVKIPKRGLI